jgi:hypothetical protein
MHDRDIAHCDVKVTAPALHEASRSLLFRQSCTPVLLLVRVLACCSRVEGLRLVVVSAGEHPPHFGRRGDGRDSARRLRLCDAHARALAHAAARHAAGGRSRPLVRTRSALAAPTSAPGLTGLTPPTSAPGLGSPHPHLRRDWLTPPTIRAGAGPLVASSKGQVRLGPVIASAGRP